MTSRKRLVGGQELAVLNPRGNPPPIPVLSMAARTADLSKRTVYFVDVRFMNGDVLLKEIQQAFSRTIPGDTDRVQAEDRGICRRRSTVVGGDQKGSWASGHGDRPLKHLCAGGRRALHDSGEIGNTGGARDNRPFRKTREGRGVQGRNGTRALCLCAPSGRRSATAPPQTIRARSRSGDGKAGVGRDH